MEYFLINESSGFDPLRLAQWAYLAWRPWLWSLRVSVKSSTSENKCSFWQPIRAYFIPCTVPVGRVLLRVCKSRRRCAVETVHRCSEAARFTWEFPTCVSAPQAHSPAFIWASEKEVAALSREVSRDGTVRGSKRRTNNSAWKRAPI